MSDIDDAARAIGSMGFDADMAKNLIEMVSISFHAGREESAAEIASLRAQLEGCKEMFAHTAERANEYVKAFQQQEGKLESARKALEFIRDGYERVDINHVDFRVGAYKAALSALSDEKGQQ